MRLGIYTRHLVRRLASAVRRLASAASSERRAAGWLAVGLALLATAPIAAQTVESKAQVAFLQEYSTGAVLFQKGADEPMVPASLVKIMTAAVVFEAIKSGRIRLDDRFTISENAWRTGGGPSRTQSMFANVRSQVAVSDLLRGLVVQAGNDAAIALAEGLAGSESAFADLMNATAKKIGMTRSVFRNATGLPQSPADPPPREAIVVARAAAAAQRSDPAVTTQNPAAARAAAATTPVQGDQTVTARDMAILVRYIVTDFPDLYKIYAEREFTWNKIRQFNRNPLIEANVGADGLAVGGTDQSGFAFVGSAARDGVRLILVVGGTRSEKERSDEARKLFDWGFRSFKRAQLFVDGATIAEAAVFAGERPTVGLRTAGPVDMMVPTGRDRLSVVADYRGPLAAPVAAGAEVGTLKILIGGQVAATAPLVTTEAVGKGDFRSRAAAGLRELLWGWW
ncbi:MAG: D-alanyl-D-alanine carboxypeptidase family protein [Bauldia sp.]